MFAGGSTNLSPNTMDVWRMRPLERHVAAWLRWQVLARRAAGESLTMRGSAISRVVPARGGLRSERCDPVTDNADKVEPGHVPGFDLA